jgi:Mor family transcriptional regulator
MSQEAVVLPRRSLAAYAQRNAEIAKLARGMTCTELAQKYNISPARVRQILAAEASADPRPPRRYRSRRYGWP